jgi:hypothetical protein
MVQPVAVADHKRALNQLPPVDKPAAILHEIESLDSGNVVITSAL